MTSAAKKEFEAIRRASTAAQKDLYSADKAIAKKAESELGDVANALKAWAKRHGLKLREHVVTQPETETARKRKCQSIIDIPGSAPETCVLVGIRRRGCLYSCFNALGPGLEF